MNAIVNNNLSEIDDFIKRIKKQMVYQKIYDTELIKSIENFKKNPSKHIKKMNAPKIPDGSSFFYENQ